jgi:hypothetical protein
LLVKQQTAHFHCFALSCDKQTTGMVQRSKQKKKKEKEKRTHLEVQVYVTLQSL